MTTGEGDDEETKLYFSKPLKSAGEDGTGEARNVITLEDGDIDEDFGTVSVDGVIYTIGVTGQTIGFTRDSTATEAAITESAEKQKFLAEVKATTLSVDGLPGKNTISGLSVDKDGDVLIPIMYKNIDGDSFGNIFFNKNEWKNDVSWGEVNVIN